MKEQREINALQAKDLSESLKEAMLEQTLARGPYPAGRCAVAGGREPVTEYGPAVT